MERKILLLAVLGCSCISSSKASDKATAKTKDTPYAPPYSEYHPEALATTKGDGESKATTAEYDPSKVTPPIYNPAADIVLSRKQGSRGSSSTKKTETKSPVSEESLPTTSVEKSTRDPLQKAAEKLSSKSIIDMACAMFFISDEKCANIINALYEESIKRLDNEELKALPTKLYNFKSFLENKFPNESIKTLSESNLDFKNVFKIWYTKEHPIKDFEGEKGIFAKIQEAWNSLQKIFEADEINKIQQCIYDTLKSYKSIFQTKAYNSLYSSISSYKPHIGFGKKSPWVNITFDIYNCKSENLTDPLNAISKNLQEYNNPKTKERASLHNNLQDFIKKLPMLYKLWFILNDKIESFVAEKYAERILYSEFLKSKYLGDGEIKGLREYYEDNDIINEEPDISFLKAYKLYKMSSIRRKIVLQRQKTDEDKIYYKALLDFIDDKLIVFKHFNTYLEEKIKPANPSLFESMQPAGLIHLAHKNTFGRISPYRLTPTSLAHLKHNFAERILRKLVEAAGGDLSNTDEYIRLKSRKNWKKDLLKKAKNKISGYISTASNKASNFIPGTVKEKLKKEIDNTKNKLKKLGDTLNPKLSPKSSGEKTEASSKAA